MESGSPMLQARPIARMGPASNVAASTFVSPLTQVKHGLVGLDLGSAGSVSNGTSIAARRMDAPPPALDFNLFRTASVYSVDSISSFDSNSSFNSDSFELRELERHWAENALRTATGKVEDGDDTGDKTPTTPRGKVPFPPSSTATSTAPTPTVATTGYFDLGPVVVTPTKAAPSPWSISQPIAGPSRPSPPRDDQLTPTRSFVIKGRPGQAFPVRSMSASQPSLRSPTKPHPISPPGSGPYALHHAHSLPPRSASMSACAAPTVHQLQPHHVPSPQPVAEDAAELASIHGEQGSDWGEDEQQFEWLDTTGAPEALNGTLGGSPNKGLARLRARVPSMRSEGRKLKKPLVFPRRAAPPPPPGPGSPREGLPAPSPSLTIAISPDPSPPKSTLVLPAPKTKKTAPPLLQVPSNIEKSSSHPQPVMVALKDGDETLNKASRSNAASRNSGLSIQSVAYSFYDLDGANTPTTAKANGELVFPHGKYTKVSASKLDAHETRKRLHSDATIHLDVANTPEDFVRKGVEARGKGDLPKSAWYFMQAAESGSATGRMYWGLALRHGWGIAKDEKRAFAELRHACDDAMARGGLDLHGTPKAVKLTPQQKKSLNRELAMGLFEVGNCFLNGVGVKKTPDVAISYLRFAADLGDITSQEQLGFLLSKGTSGVKKDMKEAARWYRMAIGQGSSNIGLAWVFKDKYMD